MAQPLIVAHRAGNDLEKLQKAFDLDVDYAETDVWLYRGDLEVRHKKTLWLLPLLWERWRLYPGWGPRLQLHEVLAAAKGEGRLFLDLKGGDPKLAGAVASAIDRAGSAEAVAFSTPVWSHLDRAAELLPDAPRFYTISNEERMADIRPRLGRREISAVSIDGRIVTAEIIAELRASGVETIVSWANETEDAARHVLACGVSGITSKNFDLLAGVRSGKLGSGG